MDNCKWIVVWWVADGFAFAGPFDTAEEAMNHGECTSGDWVWEVARLDAPEDDAG